MIYLKMFQPVFFLEIFSIKISIVIYIRMKITIDNIINFMKNKQNLVITDKQVKEIKKHFYKDVEKLVYWSFTEKYFDIKLEGIITKKFYDRITKGECNNKEYSFGPNFW